MIAWTAVLDVTRYDAEVARIGVAEAVRGWREAGVGKVGDYESSTNSDRDTGGVVLEGESGERELGGVSMVSSSWGFHGESVLEL